MKTATVLGQYGAFGWKFSRMSLPAGAKYAYIVPGDVPRSALPAVSLWTRGRVTGLNLTTGASIDDRVPGVLTSDLSRLVRAGRFVLTAEKDSEWWCVSSRTNRGSLPGLRKLALAAGETAHLKAGDRVLICAGAATLGDFNHGTGSAVHAAVPGQLLAVTDVLGLYIDRSL